jgi:hypothetical protein
LEYIKKLLKTPVHLLREEELSNSIRDDLRSILPSYIDIRAGKKGKTDSFLGEIRGK